MAALANAVSASDSPWTLTAPITVSSFPAEYTIDSEQVLITGGAHPRWSVTRGQNGSARAAHAAGAALTAGWGGGGGGVPDPSGAPDGQVPTVLSEEYVLGNPNTLSNDDNSVQVVTAPDELNMHRGNNQSIVFFANGTISLAVGNGAIVLGPGDSITVAHSTFADDGSFNLGPGTIVTTVDGPTVIGPSDILTINPDFSVIINGAQELRIDGTGVKINGALVGTQAAHVADGSTVDQLRDALIASGLMAAS